MGCSASTNTEQQTDIKKRNSTSNLETFIECRNFHDHYILGEKVGHGSFAQVYFASKVQHVHDTSDNSNTEEVVKIIELRNPSEEVSHSMQQSAIQEANVWRHVGLHQNVIKLIDFFWGGAVCYFVMERCAMSLFTALEKEPHVNEKTIGLFLAQMAKGIAYVHRVRVVHRDIKPDNFLVGGDGRHVKLCDFGLSSLMPQNGGLQGVFGTAPYMCPEMLANEPYDQKADVWSFAVLVYVLFFGCFPYMPEDPSAGSMKQAILDNRPKPCFKPWLHHDKASISTNVKLFIFALLIRSPSRRLAAEQVLLLPYMLQATGSMPWPEDMPSLRPRLHCAQKLGAFAKPDHECSKMEDRGGEYEKNQLDEQSFKQTSSLDTCSTRATIGTILKSEEIMCNRKSPPFKRPDPECGKMEDQGGEYETNHLDAQSFKQTSSLDTCSTRASIGTIVTSEEIMCNRRSPPAKSA